MFALITCSELVYLETIKPLVYMTYIKITSGEKQERERRKSGEKLGAGRSTPLHLCRNAARRINAHLTETNSPVITLIISVRLPLIDFRAGA